MKQILCAVSAWEGLLSYRNGWCCFLFPKAEKQRILKGSLLQFILWHAAKWYYFLTVKPHTLSSLKHGKAYTAHCIMPSTDLLSALKHHYTVLQGEISHFTIIKTSKNKKIKTNGLIHNKQQQVLYIHKQHGFPGTHI